MPLTAAALPPLLAGPVVRRVESDLVSVWIATSRSYQASLLLFDGADVVALDARDDPRATWVSVPQTTLQVGANLHVLTVVLDLRNPGGNAERSAGATLVANHTYSYDLRLVDASDSSQRHNLRTLGLLEGAAPLGYDPEELPTFRTCPQELDRLVIVHGSCRQLFSVPPVEDDPALDDRVFGPPNPDSPPDPNNPDKLNTTRWPLEEPTPESPGHVGDEEEFPAKSYPQLPKRDGMLWIDTLIEARGPVPMVERPHQLFLTGDQIYADQASADVLPALNNLAHLLIGEEELGANPQGTLFTSATLENFPPGFRSDIVQRSAGFTTTSGSSHLLSFGEFAAYYLLTWSPSLWELGDALWPETFNPSAVSMPDDWRIRFLYHREPPSEEDEQNPEYFSDAYHTLRCSLPVDKASPPSPPLAAHPAQHAEWFFLQRRAWIASRHWSPLLFEWWTRRFRRGLPRVRRALANVPTYMVADDHAVPGD